MRSLRLGCQKRKQGLASASSLKLNSFTTYAVSKCFNSLYAYDTPHRTNMQARMRTRPFTLHGCCPTLTSFHSFEDVIGAMKEVYSYGMLIPSAAPHTQHMNIRNKGCATQQMEGERTLQETLHTIEALWRQLVITPGPKELTHKDVRLSIQHTWSARPSPFHHVQCWQRGTFSGAFHTRMSDATMVTSSPHSSSTFMFRSLHHRDTHTTGDRFEPTDTDSCASPGCGS